MESIDKDSSLIRESQLQEQGWTRRFTSIGFRLRETAELYQQLGFEVLLEPADAANQSSSIPESCKGCIISTLAQTIYTRPVGYIQPQTGKRGT